MADKNSIPVPHSVTVEVGGRPLILETGKIAKQANGAIVARYGDTVILKIAEQVKIRIARSAITQVETPEDAK